MSELAGTVILHTCSEFESDRLDIPNLSENIFTRNCVPRSSATQTIQRTRCCQCRHIATTF